MIARRYLPSVVATGLLVLTGCSKTADSPTVQPAPTDAAVACPPGAPQRSPIVITIANLAYSPATVTAKVCQTVHVVNTDDLHHTWSGRPGPFGSPTLSKNDTYDYRFTAPGAFRFGCHFHDFMAGTITVTS